MAKIKSIKQFKERVDGAYETMKTRDEAKACYDFAREEFKNAEDELCAYAAANPDGMPMSFLSNHDMDRIAGAFVTENNMRMAANLYLLAPGSPTI